MGSSENLAAVVLAHIDREFPHKTGLIWSGPDDVVAPRVASPAFFGSFDWHSSVHSHWTLARLWRLGVERDAIAEVFDRHLTREGLEAERKTLGRPDRRGFEMPYGIAWLLALAAELAAIADGDPRKDPWSRAIAPLATLARDRFAAWLERLAAPIRSGEHSQTAWAMTLALEASAALGDPELGALIGARAADFYGGDVDAPLAYEPSAYDFLSPALAEAELMAAVLDRKTFGRWWRRFATALADSFAPVATADRIDGKLAHWDGLNLSRAWMLAAVARALEAGDERERLESMAAEHLAAGEAGLASASYAGTHWLPTFALRARLLVTAAGEST